MIPQYETAARARAGLSRAGFGAVEHADAAREPSPEVRAVLARLARGLGFCGTCRTARATVLIGGVDGPVRCKRCSDIGLADEGRNRQLVALRAAVGDADRLRHLRLLRAEAGPSTRSATVLTGHLAVFDSPGRVGQYTETIRPGAFSAALRRRAITVNVDHVGPPIATTSDGSLALCEDHAGLLARIDLRAVDGTLARRLLEHAHRGELRGSFGFDEQNSHVEYSRPPVAERLLRFIDLTSVSLVTGARGRAAYRSTWVLVDDAASQHKILRLNDAVRARRLVEAHVA
jgi:hypothetical protein